MMTVLTPMLIVTVVINDDDDDDEQRLKHSVKACERNLIRKLNQAQGNTE